MDGVVNSAETFKKAHEDKEYKLSCLEKRPVPEFIDPILRSRINEILTIVPDCKIVWSSTWRKGLRNSKVLIEGMFNQCGFKENSFLGYTPITNEKRWVEIALWLDTFGNRFKVDKCVIIDDDLDANIPTLVNLLQLKKIWDKFKPEFFNTDNKIGITEEIKNKILVYFLN